MSDIVDRLREQSLEQYEFADHELMREAAAEIEKLRADLRSAKMALQPEQKKHAKARQEIERLRAQIVASEELCLAAAGEIDRLSRVVAEMQNAQRRQELTAREEV